LALTTSLKAGLNRRQLEELANNTIGINMFPGTKGNRAKTLMAGTLATMNQK
jgi:hypothetical protein